MNLSLKFEKSHNSITSLPPTTLPSFTLITGLNGSGKTHFLEAIQQGAISTGIPIGEIRYFSWANLVPRGRHQEIAPRELAERELKALNQAHNAFRNIGDHAVRNAIMSLGLPQEALKQGTQLARLDAIALQKWIPEKAKAEEAARALHNAAVHASHASVGHIDGDSIYRTLLWSSKIPPVLLTKDELAEAVPIGGAAQMFQEEFATLFVKYRDAKLANDLEQLAASKGDPDAVPLSDQQFIEKYNIPPWDFVNRILESAGIDFIVEKPTLYRSTPYRLHLRKKSSGATLEYETLSSGERVLFAFAHAVYYANDRRQLASFPKLLLLDEVDATLHPSMVRQILKTITETLVKTLGIRVIAATHSPTTVALAPEESIYVMKDDSVRLYKSTKNEALNALLEGVPTVALDFHGRRQVFVESDKDALVYSRVYEITKTSLNQERSLTFLAAGSNVDGVDRDNGSARVRRVVDLLEQAKSQSVFGILDWDGKNEPKARLKVLAVGVRNGLENCVFDPLVLAILIAREAQNMREHIGLTATTPTDEFRRMDSVRLQEIVDQVQNMIVGNVTDAVNRVECGYQGGLRLQLRSDYLQMDDHKLETRILEAIAPLRGIRAKNLKVHTVMNVMAEFPNFIPDCFATVFKEILDAVV